VAFRASPFAILRMTVTRLPARSSAAGLVYWEVSVAQLLIGARHLHLPGLSAAPFFHGFLVIEYGHGDQRVFSADKDKGLLYAAPLLLYEDIFDVRAPRSPRPCLPRLCQRP
jgi:hypothetical protein